MLRQDRVRLLVRQRRWKRSVTITWHMAGARRVRDADFAILVHVWMPKLGSEVQRRRHVGVSFREFHLRLEHTPLTALHKGVAIRWRSERADNCRSGLCSPCDMGGWLRDRVGPLTMVCLLAR